MEAIMPYSQPCTYLIVEGLHEVRSFLKSDAAHFLLALLAVGNAVLRYLNQCRLPEANELAAAVLTAMIMALIVAASQCEAPRMMLAGIRCARLEAAEYATKIALRRASRVNPAHAGRPIGSGWLGQELTPTRFRNARAGVIVWRRSAPNGHDTEST
jgi:hypothetical protein